MREWTLALCQIKDPAVKDKGDWGKLARTAYDRVQEGRHGEYDWPMGRRLDRIWAILWPRIAPP